MRQEPGSGRTVSVLSTLSVRHVGSAPLTPPCHGDSPVRPFPHYPEASTREVRSPRSPFRPNSVVAFLRSLEGEKSRVQNLERLE